MPNAIPQPCNEPGCQTLVPRGRCPRHQRRRPSASAMGYDRDWQRLRREHLKREPRCRACGAPATEVDHITSIKDRPDLRLARSNLRSLCKPCHSRKTAMSDGRWGSGPR